MPEICALLASELTKAAGGDCVFAIGGGGMGSGKVSWYTLGRRGFVRRIASLDACCIESLKRTDQQHGQQAAAGARPQVGPKGPALRAQLDRLRDELTGF
jgi:hypothetical protein